MDCARERWLCSGKQWVPRGARADAVAVLMSGGVDSSVSAAMLVRAGRDTVGITMQVPSAVAPRVPGAELAACCGTGAAEVAAQVGIPHYFVDVREEFRRFVIEPFREAYREGRTPSPCIACNTHVKFGAVLRLLHDSFGIEQVATGHYARVVERDERLGLYAALDERKDQSYFLYGIRRTELARVLFPVGGQTKERTRQLAAEWGLAAADRDESQELCFAAQGDYRAALGEHPDAGPGDVVDTAGQVIGRHEGISRYTIGQRQGLRIAAGVPLYVVDIDPVGNTITVGDRAAAGSRRVRAEALNVLAPEELESGREFLGKVRYKQRGDRCRLLELDADAMTVEFLEPCHGVSPGQHLVLYSGSGEVVVGGEIVRESRGAEAETAGCGLCG